jgi:hypothetical protein
MKTNKLIVLLAFSLGLSMCKMFGHDVPVHRLITLNASESAYDRSSAYHSFFDVTSSDLPFADATNFMVIGSAREDDKLKDDPIGGNRSLNHFYDPINKRGLTDWGWPVSVLRQTPLGQNSFDWSSISNAAGVNVGSLINKNGTYNIWSWQNARYYEWLGLTADNKADRQAALTNMFRAVGQVIHLLEDTSQPQHVRNEQHLDTDPIFNANLRSRSAIEDYGLAHSNSLNYAHSMLDWRSAGFAQLKDFWDRDFLRTGGASALQADLSGGSSTLGLAEFDNGNFIGQRAIYGEFFHNHTDIHYFQFPSLTNTTQPQLKPNHLLETAQLGDVTLANFKHGTRLYISKIGAGVPVTYHSALSYLIAEHPGKSSGMPILTIADDNVISNYLDILIPKAVKYSAGLLDYYFRGDLGIAVSNVSSGTFTMQITNRSGQAFNGGGFHLFYDDAESNRTEIVAGPDYHNFYTGTLASNGVVTTTFHAPDNITTNYLLVFRGTIGVSNGSSTALDPVDAGLAIAAQKFTAIASNYFDGAVIDRWQNVTKVRPPSNDPNETATAAPYPRIDLSNAEDCNPLNPGYLTGTCGSWLVNGDLNGVVAQVIKDAVDDILPGAAGDATHATIDHNSYAKATVTAGSFVTGDFYKIVTVGTTDFTAVSNTFKDERSRSASS